MTTSEYRTKLKETLDNMDNRIDRLEKQVDNAKAEARGKLREILDEVKSKRDSARVKLEKLGDIGEVATATDSPWNEMKSGVDAAWSELEKSYERARSRFEDELKKKSKDQSSRCA